MSSTETETLIPSLAKSPILSLEDPKFMFSSNSHRLLPDPCGVACQNGKTRVYGITVKVLFVQRDGFKINLYSDCPQMTEVTQEKLRKTYKKLK